MLAEASEAAGIPVEELLKAIKDGLLQARFFQNTGLYHVDAEELRRFMRRTRRGDPLAALARRKVLIIDDNVSFSESLRWELARDKRIEVRTATWSQDGQRSVEAFSPHLVLLGWKSLDPVVEGILLILGQPETRRRTHVLAYGGNTTVVVQGQEAAAQERLEAIGARGLLSRAGGIRAILERTDEILGLKKQTHVAPPDELRGITRAPGTIRIRDGYPQADGV